MILPLCVPIIISFPVGSKFNDVIFSSILKYSLLYFSYTSYLFDLILSSFFSKEISFISQILITLSKHPVIKIFFSVGLKDTHVTIFSWLKHSIFDFCSDKLTFHRITNPSIEQDNNK